MIDCPDYDSLAALADWYAAAEMRDAEIECRTQLLGMTGDVADRYNLAVAMLDGGYPVLSWFEEIAAKTPPWDPTLTYALEILAEHCDDPQRRRAIHEQVDYLKGLHDGTAATQGPSSHPSSAPAASAD